MPGLLDVSLVVFLDVILDIVIEVFPEVSDLMKTLIEISMKIQKSENPNIGEQQCTQSLKEDPSIMVSALSRNGRTSETYERSRESVPQLCTSRGRNGGEVQRVWLE